MLNFATVFVDGWIHNIMMIFQTRMSTTTRTRTRMMRTTTHLPFFLLPTLVKFENTCLYVRAKVVVVVVAVTVHQGILLGEALCVMTTCGHPPQQRPPPFEVHFQGDMPGRHKFENWIVLQIFVDACMNVKRFPMSFSLNVSHSGILVVTGSIWAMAARSWNLYNSKKKAG